MRFQSDEWAKKETKINTCKMTEAINFYAIRKLLLLVGYDFVILN